MSDTNIPKITREILDGIPLPATSDTDDKEERGVVVAIGGSHLVPGAIRLSGVGALRAGAGKLQIGTVQRSAIHMGIEVPEALVVALPTTRSGEIASNAGGYLATNVANANAVLVGPGMSSQPAPAALVRALCAKLAKSATIVLDGGAIAALQNDNEIFRSIGCRAIITPHAREMALLVDLPPEEVKADAAVIAQHCAQKYQTVVVLKGSTTFVAHPTGEILEYCDGKAGLGTSGSGDVLAGIVVGLAARGAPPMAAAAWGVWAHGSAGNVLTNKIGYAGFIASDLLMEIPQFVNG